MTFLTIGLLAAALALSAGGQAIQQNNPQNNRVAPVQNTLPPMPASPDVELGAWEKYSGEYSYLFDNDESTVLWLKQPGSTSYLDIEFSSTVEIYDIQIKFNGNDYLREGRFRWSNNGTNYMLIDDFSLSANETVNMQAFGVSATHLRLQSLGDNSGQWVQISEIKINQGTFNNELIQKISFANFAYNYLPTDSVGFETSLNSLVDQDPGTFTRFSGATANSTYIQFDLKEATTISHITYQNPESAKVYSEDHIFGGKFQYFDSSISDYVDAPDFTNQTRNNYDKQIVFMNVTTTSIRFVINDVSGWIIAGDFIINDPVNPRISVQNEDALSIYEGSLLNLLDNDSSTYCWFQGKISSITLDFGQSIEVKDVFFNTGNGSDGDKIESFVQYSSDDSTYYDLVDGYTPKYTDTIELETPVMARYVRLKKHYAGGWNAIKDFTVNNGERTFEAVGSGLVKPSAQDSDEANVIDGDLNTTIWYDWQFTSGTYFLLDLKEQTSISNIAFLQGGFTHDSYAHLTEGNDDKLTSGQLSYSKNGYNWTNVSTDCTVANVYYEFESAITARYVKMTYTGTKASPSGLVIREFTVNYSKQAAAIEWDDLTPSYTGSIIKGYYRVSYSAEFTVNYHNVRKDTDSSTAPINPGQYVVTVSATANNIYNSNEETRNLHIMDTVAHFVSDWDAMMDDGDYCNLPDELLDLIDRYDYDLSVEDKATVGAHEYTGYQGNTYTIAQGIEYARNRQLPPNNNNNSGVIAFGNIENNNYAIILTFICVIALTSLAVCLFIYKKRRDNH